MEDNNEIKKYGLVLGGGGAKGAYEMGAIKALSEMGILDNLSAVAGTSIGAVNMVLLASRNIERAETVWKNINADDFIEFDGNEFDITRDGDGLLSREGLKRLLKENGDYEKIKNSEIPQYITVSNKLPEGKLCVEYIKLNGKDVDIIESYIMASSAIPIVYDAVSVENGFYCDGGLCDNNPIKPIYDEGIRDIIVISNDQTFKVPSSQFSDASISLVSPSSSIFLDALVPTGDFDKNNAVYRFELGYLDAKLSLPYLLKGEKAPDLTHNRVIAEQKYKQAKLSSNVSGNMSALENMLGRYGIDL